MTNNDLRRFGYAVDISDLDGTWGVFGFKEFASRDQALVYAENLADVNRNISVSVQINPRDRARVPRSA